MDPFPRLFDHFSIPQQHPSRRLYMSLIRWNPTVQGLQENATYGSITPRLQNALIWPNYLAGTGSGQNPSTHSSCSRPRSFKTERSLYIQSKLPTQEKARARETLQIKQTSSQTARKQLRLPSPSSSQISQLRRNAIRKRPIRRRRRRRRRLRPRSRS